MRVIPVEEKLSPAMEHTLELAVNLIKDDDLDIEEILGVVRTITQIASLEETK